MAGLRNIEPNVPEWAGRYPNLYGLAGGLREAVQPFMRGSLIDVGLSRIVGYPVPKFITAEEQMSLPIGGMYVGPSAKGWAGLRGKFSGLADKAERAEISDVGARIKIDPLLLEKYGKRGEKFVKADLGDILEHPELYKQYPEYRNIQTQLNLQGVPTGGSYVKGDIVLEGSPLAILDKSAKQTLLHEIQHAIQEKEGWAKGGSPEEFAKSKDIAKLKQEHFWALKDNNTVKAKQIWGELQDTLHRNYRNLAGEIEGRDTSARADLTAEQRASTLPYTSEDIPLSEVIVKKDGGRPQFSKEEATDASKGILGSERGSSSTKLLPKQQWRQGEGFMERRMSPDDFLSEADKTMAAKYPGWQTQPIERKAVEHYKSKISKGEQIEPIYIDKAGLAEGRHRATAYKELGYKEVPVHVKEAAMPEQRSDYGLREKLQKIKDEGDIEQFRKLVYEDPLTGVSNRRAFDDVYPEAMKQGKKFASMDASGVKYINDTYGHEAGDTFLKEYTKALKDEGVDLYRVGGDEMVAIFGKGDYGKLKRAEHNFSAKEILIKDLKGNPVTLKGAKFQFGVGKTIENGDVALLKKRAGMEAAGKRAATGGKPVGLSEFTKEEALAELKRRGKQ